jgi:hypothetical protein
VHCLLWPEELQVQVAPWYAYHIAKWCWSCLTLQSCCAGPAAALDIEGSGKFGDCICAQVGVPSVQDMLSRLRRVQHVAKGSYRAHMSIPPALHNASGVW